MTKTEYIREFMSYLEELSEEEKRQIEEYYEELICDSLESGKTEEECIEAFGNPREAAMRFCESYEKSKLPEKYSGEKRYQPEGEIHTVDVQAEMSQIEIHETSAGGKVCVELKLDEERDIVHVRETEGVFRVCHEFCRKKHGKKGIRNFFEAFFSCQEGPKIRILLPKDFGGALQVKTSNAKITMQEIRGLSKTFLTSSNAPVNMENCIIEKVKIRTGNAAVILSQINAAEIDAVTSNGHIEVKNSQCEKMGLKSSNASIRMERLTAGKLTAVTSNGKLCAEGCKSDEILLCTSNGSITGTVIGDMHDFAIKSRTSNGSSNLPNTGYTNQKKTLTAETSNGKIRIEFQS